MRRRPPRGPDLVSGLLLRAEREGPARGALCALLAGRSAPTHARTVTGPDHRGPRITYYKLVSRQETSVFLVTVRLTRRG